MQETQQQDEGHQEARLIAGLRDDPARRGIAPERQRGQHDTERQKVCLAPTQTIARQKNHADLPRPQGLMGEMRAAERGDQFHRHHEKQDIGEIGSQDGWARRRLT